MSHKLDHTIRSVRADDHIGIMQLYDVDLKSNHIYLMGREDFITGNESAINEPGVEYAMANRFIKNMNLCMRVNPKKAIVIHMKTCGGDYVEGMAIYDMIKSCPVPVTILSYTHARSMSSLILQAANKRVLMPHSYFMFHEGTLAYEGTYKTVMSNAEFDRKGRKAMLAVYTEVMHRDGKFKGKPIKTIEKWLDRRMEKKEDVFIEAKEAVLLGFADEVFNYNWKELTNYSEEQLSRG